MTARRLAVRALVRQEQNGYSNLVLDSELNHCTPALSPRDAAFASRIFYTTIERQNLIDWMLARYCAKPLEKMDAPVRAILRSGVAQAAFMDVPLPAAVNESVKLTRSLGKSSACGMVNAVLRRAAVLRPRPEEWPDLTDRLVTYYSMSRPVAELLTAQYPEDAEAMAASFLQNRPTAVRVNPLRASDEALTKELTSLGNTVRPGPWEHCLLVDFSGTPAAAQAFREGEFHVQGLASQFAALSVGAVPGMRVLDLCAAPGGKSVTMAQCMGDEGEILSGELVPGRVQLLTKAFERCGIHCARPFQGDASVFSTELGTFDRVLCDVPCSGLGVMGKKPDIRYKSMDGIENLQKVQQKILQNGARYLAQNGRLVYSTCTVNFYENEEQIRQFLQDNPDFHMVNPEIHLAGMKTGEYGTVFLPHKTGTDGFFVSVLERKK